MRRFRRKSRRPHFFAEVSLTPLIDTALTLLVIFMITAPMVHNAIRVALPTGHMKEHESATCHDIVVSVDKHGTLFFNDAACDMTALVEKLKECCVNDQDRVVFVKADTEVAYGAVWQLVNGIKAIGGVKYVALSAKRA
jgi:biopolymer transport protein ExbD